jgi:1,4-alpha-glucan branching enzyme
LKNDPVPSYLFHQGNNFKSYEYMGAHRLDSSTTVFRVWAPHASAVSVVGDFNAWNTTANPLTRLSTQGIWEGFATGIKQFDIYKYNVVTAKGKKLLKSARAQPQNSMTWKVLNGTTGSG